MDMTPENLIETISPLVYTGLLAATRQDEDAMFDTVQSLGLYGSEAMYAAFCMWTEVYAAAEGLVVDEHEGAIATFLAVDNTTGAQIPPDQIDLRPGQLMAMQFMTAHINSDMDTMVAVWTALHEFDDQVVAAQFARTILTLVGGVIRNDNGS